MTIEDDKKELFQETWKKVHELFNAGSNRHAFMLCHMLLGSAKPDDLHKAGLYRILSYSPDNPMAWAEGAKELLENINSDPPATPQQQQQQKALIEQIDRRIEEIKQEESEEASARGRSRTRES